MTPKIDVGRSRGRGTYREVEFTSFSHFLGKDLEELEKTWNAALVVADGRHYIIKDILPCCHLNRELRHADAKLCPYWLWAAAVLL